MSLRKTLLAALTVMLVASTTWGTTPPAAPVPKSAGQKAIQKNGEDGQYTFLVFWKAQDAKTDEMIRAVQTTLEASKTTKTLPATIMTVNITDANEKSLIGEYDATRAPMPLLLAIAPNGAVTKAFIKPFTQPELLESFVSTGMTQMLKAMQDGKLAFVCITSDANADGTIPAAVRAFQADPKFASATTIVLVNAGDAAEKKLLDALKVKTDALTEPVAIMLAPPGQIIGQFTSRSTQAEVVQALTKLQGACGPNGCGPSGCAPPKK
ncbi:MAG: hypothetical protein ACRC46_14205 [Thermoguttaceae bacterium]